MIVVALDAGAAKAGLAIVRATREPAGVRFTCLRHAHLELFLDGGEREAAAERALVLELEQTHVLLARGEPWLLVVEGVEGHVYAGRSTTHLFDTADQAGWIRGVARAWARAHGAHVQVKRTTASAVRRFLFGRTRAGDNEVVLAVRACVASMPPLPVPVPSPSAKAYAAMHSYDAAAVALVTAAEALGMARIALPDQALAEIAVYRAQAEREAGEKKARAAMKDAGAKVPRVQSRHTRRRRSQAATAAARRA